MVAGIQKHRHSVTWYEDMQDWVFPREALLSTPSVLSHAVTVSSELVYRAKLISFLRAVAISLRLSQRVIATAACFFHRFYLVHPLSAPYDIAATCLYIATKVEESPCRLEEFARECSEKAAKRSHVSQKQVQRWQQLILANEALVLEAIRFDLVVEHPYVSLLHLDHTRDMPCGVVRLAWAFCNDSYRLPLCVLFVPRVIACAAIQFAYDQLGYPFHLAPEKQPSRQDTPACGSWLDWFQVDPAEVDAVLAMMKEDVEQRRQTMSPALS